MNFQVRRQSAESFTAAVPVAQNARAPGWIYRELGIEPVINCGGVRSTFGGSNPRPEVIEAMTAAAEAFVDIDELAEAAGRRLATLTGAEWGIITSCSMAAMALATAACLAGNDPEIMVRLPDTRGLPNKVVIPKNQRFAYDFVFRTVGAELVTVETPDELAMALDGSVIMVCVLGRATAQGPLSLQKIVEIAKSKKVPVLVDAAAQTPTSLDPWLAQGADLVTYAGGKFVRGPQSTGFLLGSKRLCQAAWLNGPPHQAFGRAMKLGKEEIVGALVALDHFLNVRNAESEHQAMLARLDQVAAPFEAVQWATTEVVPANAGWIAPRLRITWDPAVVHIDPEAIRIAMSDARPRIHIHDFWSKENSILIDPFNLADDQARVVGRALYKFLDESRLTDRRPVSGPAADVAGSWTVSVSFLQGRSEHKLELSVSGGSISGWHVTRHSRGAVTGSIDGRSVNLLAKHPGEPAPIYYTFEGRVVGGIMTGDVALGAATQEHFGAVFNRQFGTIPWSARRDVGRSE